MRIFWNNRNGIEKRTFFKNFTVRITSKEEFIIGHPGERRIKRHGDKRRKGRTEFPASSKQTFTMFIDMPLPLYCPIFICKRKATIFETSLHPPHTYQLRKRH